MRRLWIASVVILVVITIGLLCAVIYLAATDTSSDDSKSKAETETEEEALLRQFGPLIDAWKGIGRDLHIRDANGAETIYPICLTNSTTRRVVDPNPTVNNETRFADEPCRDSIVLNVGCCKATGTLEAIKKVKLVSGGWVDVVQSPPVLVQQFTLFTCVRIPTCNKNCECKIVLTESTAIVKNGKDGKPYIALVLIPSCCKCVNT